MLTITIPPIELYDEVKEEFVTSKGAVLLVEHSLVSLSKWESKWCKPFLTDIEKTYEETVDYIACMTVTQNVDPDIYEHISSSIINEVNNYIGKPMTATVILPSQSKKNREVVTAELIYYWMIALSVPFECQKWHLNRLLMLINVCSIKNAPPKKMNRREILSRNAALNAKRREELATKG